MRALQCKARSAPQAAARPGRRELPGGLHPHAPELAVGVVVLVGVLLASASSPRAAQALSIPNPVNVVGNGISSLLGTAVGPIISLAVKAFDVTSDPTEVSVREAEIASHEGNVWVAQTAEAVAG